MLLWFPLTSRGAISAGLHYRTYRIGKGGIHHPPPLPSINIIFKQYIGAVVFVCVCMYSKYYISTSIKITRLAWLVVIIVVFRIENLGVDFAHRTTYQNRSRWGWALSTVPWWVDLWSNRVREIERLLLVGTTNKSHIGGLCWFESWFCGWMDNYWCRLYRCFLHLHVRVKQVCIY